MTSLPSGTARRSRRRPVAVAAAAVAVVGLLAAACGPVAGGPPGAGAAPSEPLAAGVPAPPVAAPPVEAPPPGPVPPPVPPGAAAPIDPAEYRATAASLGTAEGVRYRFGEPGPAGAPAPTLVRPPTQDCPYTAHGQGHTYQLGGCTPEPGDYSSTHAQVAYVPEGPEAAADPGLDRIEVLTQGHTGFSADPMETWTNRSHPDPAFDRAEWQDGRPLGRPVALARGYGTGGQSSNAVVAFSGGAIGTTGTTTNAHAGFLRLPEGKVPSAVAVTNNNEFALVTVWDTVALRGQVAVIALGSWHAEGEFFGREWNEPYPGLRNHGDYRFLKLLGFVDLPGIARPTAISAATDHVAAGEWLSYPGGGNAQPSELDLSDEAVRQSFVDPAGTNAGTISEAGFAVVASRPEARVAYLDLQPLLAMVRDGYSTDRAAFDATRDVGLDPRQWPPAFDVRPTAAPVVVRTDDLPAPPTAVSTSLFGGPAATAFIATEDGTLGVWRVGGLGNVDPADPSAVVRVGEVGVGANPTSIAYAEKPIDPAEMGQWDSIINGGGNGGRHDNDLIVLSRGERAIRFVDVEGDAARVLRTLRDSRMVDPIWVEDADNHGTESFVLSVADSGGSQVLNYYWGPVVFHTNGGQRFDPGGDGFAFGGEHPLRGRPFMLSGTDVP